MPSPKVVVDEILAIAHADDRVVREQALARLPRAGWQSVFPLIAAVRDDDPAVRQLAAEGLMTVANAAEGEDYVEPLLKRSIPVLLAALSEDDYPEVRAAAANALKAVDGYYEREAMMINFADPYIRGRVRKMDGPLAAAANGDPDPAVRAAAAAGTPTGAPSVPDSEHSVQSPQERNSGRGGSLWNLFKKS